MAPIPVKKLPTFTINLGETKTISAKDHMNIRVNNDIYVINEDCEFEQLKDDQGNLTKNLKITFAGYDEGWNDGKTTLIIEDYFTDTTGQHTADPNISLNYEQYYYSSGDKHSSKNTTLVDFLGEGSFDYSDKMHMMFEDLSPFNPDGLKAGNAWLKKNKGVVKGSDFSDGFDMRHANSKLTVYTYDGHDNIIVGDKGSTIYNGNGQKDITLGSGNDTVYLGKNYTNLYMNKENNGKDVIYVDPDSEGLYIDLNGTNFKKDTDVFTLNGYDVTITNSKNKNDSIVLKNALKNSSISLDDNEGCFGLFEAIEHFYSSGAVLGNANAKKSLKLTGTFLNENLVGGKKADKIETCFGEHVINAGKGNDKIKIANGGATVVIDQGAGNDTIEFDDSSNINLIVNDSKAKITYTKSNNDLILNIAHAKSSQKVTLKNYYIGVEDSMNPGWVRNYNINIAKVDDFKVGEPIPYSKLKYITDYFVVNTTNITAQKNKNNLIIGTQGNDIIHGGNKNDCISLLGGNNTIYTGKGSTVIYADDNGYISNNDNYIISSINNQTIIRDIGGEDTLQINGTKGSDLYLYFNINKSGNLAASGSSYMDDSLVFMNSKGVDSAINKGTVLNPVSTLYKGKKVSDSIIPLAAKMSDISYKSNLNGVIVQNYFDGCQIENIVLADAKGNNKQTVSDEALSYAIDSLGENISKTLTYLHGNTTEELLAEMKAMLAKKPAGMSQKEYKNIKIKDAKRTYDVICSNGSPIDMSASKGNYIIFDSYYGTNIRTSQGYNIVRTNSNANIQYNGGVLNSQTGSNNDTYNIKFDKNTAVKIQDKGGSDSLYINGDVSNLKLFMNFDETMNTVGNLTLIDGSQLSAKNLKDGFAPKGITVKDFFSTGKMEYIQVNNTVSGYDINIGSSEMNAITDALRMEVEAWMTNHKQYSSTMEVFENGNSKDIASLVNVYKNVDMNDMFMP